MVMKSFFSWWILKRRVSVRRRHQRMNMWRRTLLRSLFSWWIFKRGSSVRRLENEHVEENITEERGSVRRRHWRMTMWRRMLLKRLCRWRIFGTRGSLWRILIWRSKLDSAAYGILRSWSTLILSAPW
jgi:hypothetical protein